MSTKAQDTTQENPPSDQFLPEEQSRAFLADFLDLNTKKKQPEEEVKSGGEEPASDAVSTGDAPPVAAPVAPEPKKKAKDVKAEPKVEPPATVAPAAPTAEEIATQVGKAVAREIRQAQPKEDEKPVIVVQDDVPAHERRLQSNLEVLAKLYPEEYGNVHTERRQFVDKLRAYEKKWLADNPGETFDPNAEEHNDFYASDPMQRVSSEHLAEAIAEQRVSAKAKELEQRIEQSERARTVLPLAESAGAAAAISIVKELAPDLAIQIGAGGKIDPDSYSAAVEADPVKAPIVAGAIQAAHQITSEIVKIYTGAVKPDPDRNPQHASLLQFGAEMERRMKSVKPSEWSDPKGRAVEDFLPSREYWTLPPAQRRNHWTFDQDDMVALAQADIRNDARQAISAEENRVNAIIAKRNGGSAPAKKPAVSQPQQPARSADPAPSKPVSPSGRGEPNLAGVTGANATGKKSSEDAWLSEFIGKG